MDTGYIGVTLVNAYYGKTPTYGSVVLLGAHESIDLYRKGVWRRLGQAY